MPGNFIFQLGQWFCISYPPSLVVSVYVCIRLCCWCLQWTMLLCVLKLVNNVIFLDYVLSICICFHMCVTVCSQGDHRIHLDCC